MRNYAFIDSQNLNLGVRSDEWRIDYRKFRLYLKNKYNVERAYMFLGAVAGNQQLYTGLQAAGFILVFKPTVRYVENGKLTVKGNVDAELVLHAAAIEYANYEKAIIVSGDGDFQCLIKFLKERDKLLRVLVPNHRYSKLLTPFIKRITQLNWVRDRLEYDATGRKKPAQAVGRNLRLSRKGSGSSGRSKP